MPYRLSGISVREGKRVALLVRGTEWTSALLGDRLEGGFELSEIREASVVIKEESSGKLHILEVSEE